MYKKYQFINLFLLNFSIFSSSVYTSSLLTYPFFRNTQHHQVSKPKTTIPVPMRDVWIIVHGTFAASCSWHTTKGDFYTQLINALSKNALVYSFSWSGSNNHDARFKAGVALKEWITKNIKKGDKLNIVGHSHGGNVAIVAAQELHKEKVHICINNLFTLGTPIRIKSYKPDMTYIRNLYNFFSYGDRIQSFLNRYNYSRVFPDHNRIFNIQLRCNGTSPLHIGMRQPLIAKYLPLIEKIVTDTIKEGKMGPFLIEFFSNKNPTIVIDANREEELTIDRNFMKNLIIAFCEDY